MKRQTSNIVLSVVLLSTLTLSATAAGREPVPATPETSGNQSVESNGNPETNSKSLVSHQAVILFSLMTPMWILTLLSFQRGMSRLLASVPLSRQSAPETSPLQAQLLPHAESSAPWHSLPQRLCQSLESLLQLCRAGIPNLKDIRAAMGVHSFSELTRLAEMAIPGKYRRFLVAESENGQIIAIVWGEGARSPVHSHGSSVCAFKVLLGEILECTESNAIGAHTHPQGAVSSWHGTSLHHEVGSRGVAITLHLYSPQLGLETEPLPMELF